MSKTLTAIFLVFLGTFGHQKLAQSFNEIK